MIYNNLWRSELYKNVSAKARVLDTNLNQFKYKINDTNKEDGRMTTNFEPYNSEDLINKCFLDTKLAEVNGHVSCIEKH